MQTKGFRITLSEEYNVTLSMILNEIEEGAAYNWSIFYLEVILKGREPWFCDLYRKSRDYKESGVQISWSDLNLFSDYIQQIINGIFIGSKSIKNIELIEEDEDLYQTYDIYIEMIDGGMWEIFTKNEALFNRLISKFKISEFLDVDFQDHLYNEDHDNKIVTT